MLTIEWTFIKIRAVELELHKFCDPLPRKPKTAP